MNNFFEKLRVGLAYIRSKTALVPKAALVLGSGLGAFAESMDVETQIEYADIPGFPVSTVPGHAGRFVFGRVGGVPAVAMQGRVHYYEGYDISDVVMPVRLMGLLGARGLLLTNASGAINTSFGAGDFMLIRDHILHSVPSPLIGANIDDLGPRFPDMSAVYDEGLRGAVAQAARELEIPLREGVYIQVSGPNFETPAEIRAYGHLGADVVGMSTACEAVAANHMGLKVCGISCISNMAAGISQNKLTHDEVQETAARVAPEFKKLVALSVERFGDLL